MKRVSLLLLILFPALLQAQNLKWQVYPLLGVDIGGSIPFPFSDIPKGAKFTPKPNPNIGLGVEYRLSEKWSLGLEASYHVLSFSAKADVRSQPFYFDNHTDVLYFSGETSTDVRLRFFEFPLIGKYAINSRWSVEPGVYYSRILDGSFKTKGNNGVLSDDKSITDSAPLPGIVSTSYNFNEFIDNWDAGLLIGVKYKTYKDINFWCRLQVGFKSIFVKEFNNIEYEMYQLRFNAGVSVPLFNI